MEINELKSKLKNYRKEDIIITHHADLQAFVRGVELDEVKENILHPSKLVYVKNQEEKYDCYFAYSRHLYHRYILTLDRKVIIVTIIKINRDWQKAVG